MNFRLIFPRAFLTALATLCAATACRKEPQPDPTAAAVAGTNLQVFQVKGILHERKPDGMTVVIRHEAIPNYMPEMTMPFRASQPDELDGLEPGDEITFRLAVADAESWIDHIRKTGRSLPFSPEPAPEVDSTQTPPGPALRQALAHYTFTNEFGCPVRFSDFDNQALAFTFFFTRCPIPEYCPRLTKTFWSASQRLQALPNAPTNWHLLSISFDTAVDTPQVLRTYAQSYAYDSNHWSFLVSDSNTLRALTHRLGYSFQPDGAFFAHSFLTVVLQANGNLQSAWPVGGDTTDNLVAEILKACTATNPVTQATRPEIPSPQ